MSHGCNGELLAVAAVFKLLLDRPDVVTEVAWTVAIHWMFASSSLDGHSVNG